MCRVEGSEGEKAVVNTRDRAQSDSFILHILLFPPRSSDRYHVSSAAQKGLVTAFDRCYNPSCRHDSL